MSERLLNALADVKTLPDITLGKIVDHIKDEALLIICLVAIFPFMQPIPIPGLSSVLGLIVLLQGFGLAIWGKPFLTNKLKKVHISHERFELIQKAAIKFSVFTSKISTFKHSMVNSRGSQILCGISIIISSAFLSLPLPIPFSNFIPALSIFFICVGLLEEDIVLVIFGHTMTMSVMWMSVFSYHLLREQIANWF